MKNKKGISLIVLVITILVMIILAGVVIVSLQDSNPIDKAKEAVKATDLSTYKEELQMNILNAMVKNPDIKKSNINESTWEEIKKYIPSMKLEHKGKFEIINGELVEKK